MIFKVLKKTPKFKICMQTQRVFAESRTHAHTHTLHSHKYINVGHSPHIGARSKVEAAVRVLSILLLPQAINSGGSLVNALRS